LSLSPDACARIGAANFLSHAGIDRRFIDHDILLGEHAAIIRLAAIKRGQVRALAGSIGVGTVTM